MIKKCSGGPTKPEIIAISLLKLQLQSTDTMADIGCGSGAVTIEAAKIAQHIYAIDHRSTAISTAEYNLKECGIKNVTLIEDEASIALEGMKIDCAFIGGTRQIEDSINASIKAGAKRIVVNAVRIETVARTIQYMNSLNIFTEAVHVSISKSYALEGETMFKPCNPVYIVTAADGGTQC
ncbi:MAG: putative cobalt-precorrin-6B C(15)-methyltransferase (decarboxylating) [Candidatus Argoarchaeum ethanivorans]|uniref:Putative cobalt-precorrin-6B C(15)-methyltransferase (Decarboxylating) n=1 Tax=Candidatus Argoarchaeum ethanivorans TaxID=2608793 RepID=A0A811TBG3_9EURY|nr:MAG: putative cobalt-precorrin-6B C(15)-methyltransferase (decarboxylating) [Candidatus Argoarchaeum ethanivorans]